MLEAFSRNGELGHWPRPNRRDPQLPKLHRRHRQIAEKILSLTHGIEGDCPTPQGQSVCQEMRSLCTRLLGIEREYWQRSGNGGLPPTFEGICGPNFATTRTLQDILDEAFLTREDIGARPLPQPSRALPPVITELGGETETGKPQADDTAPMEPKATHHPQREQRLLRLLEHHGKEASADPDPIALSDTLWEHHAQKPQQNSTKYPPWTVLAGDRTRNEGRISQVLHLYGENDQS